MVYRMNDAGTAGWHEPPYTWEEEQELYRRFAGGSGPMTVYRGPRPGGADKQAPAKEPQQEEK